MQEKEKIAIGFDIGTTSVGWSIVKRDETKKTNNLTILDMGVRLFDDPASNDSNAITRREARSRRRRIRRQNLRKKDLRKLLIKYQLVKSDEEIDDYIKSSFYDDIKERYLIPVEIKAKALEEQITLHELVIILHNYIKHRGTLVTIDLEGDKEKESKKILDKWKSEEIFGKEDITKLLPCQLQNAWYLKTGKVIGNDGNFVIKNEEYIEEIRQILSKQKIIKDEKFIDDFIELFKRHRSYAVGPGSKNSPTPYGLYRLNENNEVYKIGDNLWESLIGKCTYYKNENRNYKKSPITEYFNLMNVLANLRFYFDDDETDQATRIQFLTSEQKKKCLEGGIKNKLTCSSILKKLNIHKDKVISGLKGLDNKELIISTKTLSEWISKNNIEEVEYTNINYIKFLDKIFSYAVQKQISSERYKYLIENKKEIFLNHELVTNEMIKELSELKIFSSGTSSLSKKAQLEFIEFALSEDGNGKNQQVYFQREFKNSYENEEYKDRNYFPSNIFKDKIMPSTVKRSFNQAINVLNCILKKYGKKYDISHIAIELARETNSKDEKAKIAKINKNNEEYLKSLKEMYGVDDYSLRGENKIKFILWHEQNKLDIYDGDEIDLKHLLNNPTYYNIDHILPISKSFIDSLQNKVLTKGYINKEKGDRTPYEYLTSKGEYESYKKRCFSMLDNVQDKNRKKKLENKIKEYLLYEGNLSTDIQGFISRQLNDTRYITSLFLNELNSFFKSWKKSNNKTIIHPINGVFTHFVRKYWFREDKHEKFLIQNNNYGQTKNDEKKKNRDLYYHHAIDASIIAYLSLNQSIKKLLKIQKFENWKHQNNEKNNLYIDNETGEVIELSDDFMIEEMSSSYYYRDQMISFVDKKDKNKFVRFSRMVTTKNNFPLSNEIIYSISEKDEIDKKNNIIRKKYKVSFINLFISEKDVLDKYFGDKRQEKYYKKLAIYNAKDNVYTKLNEIYMQYNSNDKTNPFLTYVDSDEVKDSLNKKGINYKLLDKIPIFTTDNIFFIRKLKCYENEITNVEEIFTPRNHNDKAFYDSLNFKSIRIYKDNNDKYIPIFINVLFVKYKNNKIVVDENKLKDILVDKNINPSSRYLEITRGKTLIKEKELYYFKGGGHRSQNKLEIAILSMNNEIAFEESNWKDAPKGNQWNIALSTIISEFKLCKTDALGNVYEIFTFDEYFKDPKLTY